MRSSLLHRVALVFLVIGGFASVAEAQEKKWGVEVGYPADVGLLWQASNRVALRADVGFSFNTTEIATESIPVLGSSIRPVVTTTSSSDSTTIGLAALFTIRNEDSLRLYLAPRGGVQLSRYSAESKIELPPGQSSSLPLSSEASDSAHGYECEVMFGGQYRLHDRVAVFGETGPSYRRSSFPRLSTSLSLGTVIPSPPQQPDARSTSIGLRGSAGLVLFF